MCNELDYLMRHKLCSAGKRPKLTRLDQCGDLHSNYESLYNDKPRYYNRLCYDAVIRAQLKSLIITDEISLTFVHHFNTTQVENSKLKPQPA